MKALIGSGLCVALAFLTTRSFAEEIQWRPAATGAAVIPANYTTLAPAQPQPLGIGLGRPIATSASGDSTPSAGIALDRPQPLIRGQAADTLTQPLPVGLPLLVDNTTPSTKKSATTPMQTVKPGPIIVESDFTAPMPRVMQSPSVANPCDCGTPIWSRAASIPAILDGGALLSAGDCGCGAIADCCDPCGDCGCGDCCIPREHRLYASASYLGWSFQKMNVPPLVTVSPVGTPAGMTGVLGLPTTGVLVDSGSQESQYHSGGRFNLGAWLPGGNFAVEVDYFFLGQNQKSESFGSTGNPQFSRPVIIGGQETVQFVSLPGVVNGSVGVNMQSQMWGLEGNLREKICCGPRYWIDFLYGYRHVDLSEGIDISENLVQLNPGGNLGIGIVDSFHTRNVFNGGQLGIQGEWHFWNRFFVGSTAKVALGNMNEQINITGLTAYTPLPNGTTTTFNSGILAASSNIGTQRSNRFAVIPEVNLKLGYEINDHWRIWAGYDFLFISSVVRPGDQIDRRLNPSQIPLPPPAGAQPLVGAAQPAPLFRTTSFYAQGFSAGLQYRW